VTPTIRRATEADLPRIIELIHLGAAGGIGAEDLGPPLPGAYYESFRSFERFPEAKVMVAEVDGEVVGTFQFHLLPSLANRALPTAEVEGVHVAEAFRGQRIGEAMLAWVAAEARRLGCKRVQLTSNKVRVDAHRFYERLGFVKSHEGMKLHLTDE
jgi:GNAT superfamily N-acetyltransferase